MFDRSKPDGTPRKLLDVGKMRALGWQASTPLADGIRATYDWYLERVETRAHRLTRPRLQKTLTRAVVPPSHHATSLNVLK